MAVTMNAAALADIMTRAERDGSHSHGLFRVPGYVKALRSGKVDGKAKPLVAKKTPLSFTSMAGALHLWPRRLGYLFLLRPRLRSGRSAITHRDSPFCSALARDRISGGSWPRRHCLHGLYADGCASRVKGCAFWH